MIRESTLNNNENSQLKNEKYPYKNTVNII